MNEFINKNTIKVIFGENNLSEVINEIKSYGLKVMLVMGGESFIKNGYHKELTDEFIKAGISWIDFKGNRTPSLKKVREGIEICRNENVDCIIGIGGGTCMDMAKTIALGVKQDCDIWSILIGEVPGEGMEHLPVGTIVTNPSSGSELNSATQITNDETQEQAGLSNVTPNFTWMNPEYLMSLSNRQLAYGQMTAFVQHSLVYLNFKRSEVAETISEAVMKSILKNLEKSLKDSTDKESRSNLLVLELESLSGITNYGKSMDWSIIMLQIIMQNYYEIGYTEAMTILFPYWLKNIYDGNDVFKSYFKNIFDVDIENKSDEEILECGLDAIFATYKKLGIAVCFKDLKKTANDSEILKSMIESFGEIPSEYTLFTADKMQKLFDDAINGI